MTTLPAGTLRRWFFHGAVTGLLCLSTTALAQSDPLDTERNASLDTAPLDDTETAPNAVLSATPGVEPEPEFHPSPAFDNDADDGFETPERRSLFRQARDLNLRANRSGAADAVYQRPFVVGGQRAALGGYMEAGATWTRDEGVNEGLHFSLARFNLFVYAQILPRIEFMSEIEFENGGQEIKIETAQLDFELTDWLSMRAGVLLIPIGAFNQDHDAPRWPLVDRPLVSETILPATLSEVGLGFHGEADAGPLRINGQLYVTNGLGGDIVANASGRTDITAGKHEGILDFDTNGRPAVSGRLALIYDRHLEFGVSTYHGAYNVWKLDGETIDKRRTLTLGALDLRASFWRMEVRGEVAMAWVQLPKGLEGLYGGRQFGWHLDVYTDLFTHQLPTGTKGRLRLVIRGEQADYYAGDLPNGTRAGDQITGLTTGLAWQLGEQLVIRSGVRQRWTRDLINNPAAREVQIQFGVASYF